MRIVITGGCGFVGAQLALDLTARGHRVVAMDNLVRRGSELNLPRLRARGIEFVHGDVRSREDFANLPKSIDLICETSAQASVLTGYENPLFDIANNALGLINVLEFARQRGCPVIFWSSSRVYSADRVNAIPRKENPTRLIWDIEKIRALGNGHLPQGFDPQFGFSEEFSVDGKQHSIYGLSKVMADLACQEYADAFGVKTVINRFGVLSGEGQFGKSEQGWLVWWVAAFHFGLPLRFIGWGGKQVRDILHIEDMCRLIEMQIEHLDKIPGEVFTVGGGMDQTLSLLEATTLLREKFGREVALQSEPAPRKADQSIYVSDIRKAQRTFGWTPRIGVSECLDRIKDWIRDNEAELRPFYI